MRNAALRCVPATKSIVYFQTAAAERERWRWLSRNSRNSAMPSPVLEDSVSTRMPGRTAWMFRLAAALSNSTTAARSEFVMMATSAVTSAAFDSDLGMRETHREERRCKSANWVQVDWKFRLWASAAWA